MSDEINLDLITLVSSLKKYSVLVVDDEGIALQLFSTTLKHFFKHVGIAQHVSIAIDKMNEYPYDALITDNILPDIFGTELITKIRNGEAVKNEEYRKKIENMPIYLITHAVESHLTDVLNLNHVYYLHKPSLKTQTILEMLCILAKSLECE
ncbi:MAG: response regulator [Campylobacterales bacterium]|nr:response regulator [Campylobacterales bacterium]